jgi:hypothetical protein
MLTVENLQILGASIFGVVFVVTFLVIAVRFPNPTDFQQTVFRIILALSAAGVASMIPGFINLEMGASQGLALRAGGAIAVFTLVYFFNPAKPDKGKSESTETPAGFSTPPDWAFRKDVRALKDALEALPLSQRLILSAIAKRGRALSPSDFTENPDLNFTRREIVYMCRELEAKSFIETRDYTDKEYVISKAVWDTLGKATKSFLSELPGDEKLRSSKTTESST